MVIEPPNPLECGDFVRGQQLAPPGVTSIPYPPGGVYSGFTGRLNPDSTSEMQIPLQIDHSLHFNLATDSGCFWPPLRGNLATSPEVCGHPVRRHFERERRSRLITGSYFTRDREGANTRSGPPQRNIRAKLRLKHEIGLSDCRIAVASYTSRGCDVTQLERAGERGTCRPLQTDSRRGVWMRTPEEREFDTRTTDAKRMWDD